MKFNALDMVALKQLRDVLYANAPELPIYLGEMETATSVSKTSVVVANTVRGVMSVWLATDSKFAGTNYYSDPKAKNYTGSTITLDIELPNTNSNVVVAYYSDCPDCGWSETEQTGTDPACATCLGLGRTLADGTAYTIPVKIMPRAYLTESLGVAGEEASGMIVFKIQAEYENMLRASMKLVLNGKELYVPADRQDFSFEYKNDASGNLREIMARTRYKEIQ